MSENADKFKKLPLIGLGTWKLKPRDTYDVVLKAIRIGYRHIDCASTYGNEKEVGKAIQSAIEEGVIQRQEMWITAKLPNTAHAPEDVRPAVQESLDDLGLDYLDAYLMHWPVATRKGVWIPRKPEHLISLDELPLEKTWAAMEQVLQDGLVHHLGVSNFSISKLKQLLEYSISGPEFNQIELHPYLQQPDMLEFCQANDIQLIAYSPLGSGDRPKPLKRKDEPVLLKDPVIETIAKQHQVPASKVLLAWALQRGTAVIPKSTNCERMSLNHESDQLQLSADEMEQIGKLDQNYRYVDGSFWVLPKGPYSLSNLWDEQIQL